MNNRIGIYGFTEEQLVLLTEHMPDGYAALIKIRREEIEQQQRVSDLIRVLKYVIDKSGFELTARIELREKRTGKEFR